jgi:hypothetical protein
MIGFLLYEATPREFNRQYDRPVGHDHILKR